MNVTLQKLNSVITLRSVDIFDFAGNLLGRTHAIGYIYLLGTGSNLSSVFFYPLGWALTIFLELGVRRRVGWSLYTEFEGPVSGCLLSRLSSLTFWQWWLPQTSSSSSTRHRDFRLSESYCPMGPVRSWSRVRQARCPWCKIYEGTHPQAHASAESAHKSDCLLKKALLASR